MKRMIFRALQTNRLMKGVMMVNKVKRQSKREPAKSGEGFLVFIAMMWMLQDAWNTEFRWNIVLTVVLFYAILRFIHVGIRLYSGRVLFSLLVALGISSWIL